MADLINTFREKAESLVTAINSETGVKATIEGLRRRMAEADRKRAMRKIKAELQRIEQQIDELLTSVGVQAVALERAGALSSPELAPLCERIIDLERLLEEQRQALAKVEAEALAAAQSALQASVPTVCPHCGKPLAPTGEFCPYCGQPRLAQASAPAPVFCAHCGAPLREGARYCAHCGQEAA